jgi:hypothetical protein
VILKEGSNREEEREKKNWDETGEGRREIGRSYEFTT